MSGHKFTAIGRYLGQPQPIITRAEGIYLYGEDGKRYIDGSGGSAAVTSIGQGVEEALSAMAAQARALTYAPTHAFATRAFLDLADLVAGLAPGEMRNHCKVWFAVTGTDAMDDAVRLAREHWVLKGRMAKYMVITRWQSYHGMSLSAGGYSGTTLRRSMFAPLFVDMPHIPPAYCYRCPFKKTYPSCDLLCARALEDMILQVGPENVAAFVAEPLVGSALGGVPGPEGYFQIIRDICTRYDVLLIVDEVLSGWGRTGRMFAIEHWGVTPDIVATAKGMTGGYAALSALIARDEVWQPLIDKNMPFISGHTMNANPVCCAGAMATIKYIVEHNLVEQAREVGGYMLERLKELLDYAMVGTVHGLGMVAGFEIVQDKATKEPFPTGKQMSRLVFDAALERGLVTYPLTGAVSGAGGHMIMLAPPLTTTREQVDEIVDILHASLEAVQRSLD